MSGKQAQKLKVVIVGAGVGGVAAAARLSKAGLDVEVIEKNTFTGGRCSLIHSNGYRFDQGPSLVLLPKVFQSTFAELGTSLEMENIHLLKCDPNYTIYFHDGISMNLSTDMSVMKNEIERWEGKEAFEKYLAFLAEAHRHYELSVEHVLAKDFPSIASLLRPAFLRRLFTLHPFDSVYTRASKYLKSDRLRRAFTFGSMYMGMSPLEAPGTYSLLQYTELVEGIWYPIGGLQRVVEALVNISTHQGAQYLLGTPVEKIRVSSEGKVQGVTLSNGDLISADIVLVNADISYAYDNLLPAFKSTWIRNVLSRLPLASLLITPHSLANKKTSCSSISFYWAMNRAIPELGIHNVFLAKDYQGSFDDIFKLHQMPVEPSFYVHVPSRVDSTAAPPNKDAIVVLVPVGSLVPHGKGAEEIDLMVKHARKIVLQTLEKRLGTVGIHEWIIHETVNTPITWKDKFNLDRGAILGLAHNFFNVLCFRPQNRHSTIDGLYFVGASTHPGTGVPICLSGAKLTAERILSDHDIEPPWSVDAAQRKKQVSELDVVRSTPSLTTTRVALCLCFAVFLAFPGFLATR